MVKIKQQLIHSTNSCNGTNNPCKYITVHQTGNTSRGANAQAHANLQSRRTLQETWHWTVDDTQAIQSYPHYFQLWHAGDGGGSGNNESIGIEWCVNSDGNYKQAYYNLVDLIAHIIQISPNVKNTNHVVSHRWWSGKDCPHQLFAQQEGITWDMLINDVNKKLQGKTVKQSQSKPTVKPQAKPQTSNNNLDKLVKDTIAGKYGNGNERKKKLGKNYNRVQNEINKRFNVKNKSSEKVDYNKLVQETLKGKYGNGETRKKKLGKHYEKVQRMINDYYYG